MSKFLRVNFEEQPWGYAKVGGMEMNATLSVHEMGTFGVGIGDVVAVSHVWGDARYEVENVQGASHRIMISSPEKMRRLLSIAERYGWKNLWLDNICINQDDGKEKLREVMKMGDVFRKTMATVILLSSTPSKLLAETIPIILEIQGLPRDQVDKWATHVDRRVCQNLVGLGRDVWYGKLWTVQESTLASTIYMAPIDEDVVVDVSGLKDCHLVWAWIKLNWFNLRLLNRKSRSSWGRAFCNRWSASAELTMYDALALTTGLKCGVEADRVYGILGLVPNVKITPTYGTSLEEVAVMVMKECVNNLKQMDLLHISGPKLVETGKRVVPTWISLTHPQRVCAGDVVHDGKCMYDENVGLKVSSPRVFAAKILLVMELGPDFKSSLHYRRLQKALNEKLQEDQIVELIRGMIVLKLPQYGNEDKAREYFNILAYAASLHPDSNMDAALREKYGWNYTDFNTLWRSSMAGTRERIYILEGITKDDNCTLACYQHTYITAMWTDELVEDTLLVVDYGGHFYDYVEDRVVDTRVPLIVAQPVQEGVMTFISTIVVDRNLLHESTAYGTEITIV